MDLDSQNDFSVGNMQFRFIGQIPSVLRDHGKSLALNVTHKKEAVTPVKRKHLLDLQVSKYGLVAALLHAGRDADASEKAVKA